MQGLDRTVNTHHSEYHCLTIPTQRMKEEKGKTVGDENGASSLTNKKALALLLRPASPTKSYTGALDRSNEILTGD